MRRRYGRDKRPGPGAEATTQRCEMVDPVKLRRWLVAVLIAVGVGALAYLLEVLVFDVEAPALAAIVLGILAAAVYLLQSNPRTRI